MIHVIAVALLVVAGAALDIVTVGRAVAQTWCDTRSPEPGESRAYSIIRDLFHANGIVDEAFASRLEALSRIKEATANVFAAFEREARAAECAARIVEPYVSELASDYRAEAKRARASREFLAQLIEMDVSRASPNWAKWEMLVAKYFADQRVDDEDLWKSRRELTELTAAVAAMNHECLTLTRGRSCERNRLAITREERARLITAVFVVMSAKPKNPRLDVKVSRRFLDVLQGSIPARDDNDVWLFDTYDATLPEMKWVAASGPEMCETLLRDNPAATATASCHRMLLLEGHSQGAGQSVWAFRMSRAFFVSTTHSTCEAFRAGNESRQRIELPPCEAFRLSPLR